MSRSIYISFCPLFRPCSQLNWEYFTKQSLQHSKIVYATTYYVLVMRNKLIRIPVSFIQEYSRAF